MEKMRMESVDMTAQNIDKIAALFPNCITETKDENGHLKKVVNFDLLRQMLSGEVLEGDESYEFTWVGKKSAIVEANKPIRKTLRPSPEESVNWDTTENLYIEGDNLDVLKLLQESYLGKVKMIYIDPPYNTGSDSFVYPDDYSMDSDEYADQIGMYDEAGNKVFIPNTDSNPRFHSVWCSMMYSRLMLARNLLRDNGVIFISIDNNEFANIKNICDAVFGEQSFVTVLHIQMSTVQGQKVRAAKAGNIVKNGEFVFVYSKDGNKTIGVRPMLDPVKYDNHYNKYLKSISTGVYVEGNLADLIASEARVVEELAVLNLIPKSRKISSTSFQEYYEYSPVFREYINTHCKEIVRVHDSVDVPADFKKSMEVGKVYLYESESRSYYVSLNDAGVVTQRISLGEKLQKADDFYGTFGPTTMRGDWWAGFYLDMGNVSKEGGVNYDNGKKPVRLIKQLIEFCTDEDDIILDFFCGSATTAHAVMELCRDDGKHRHFIMVQMPENLDESLLKANGSEKSSIKQTIKFLDSVHRPHILSEIGKERIVRSGTKISEEEGMFDSGVDVGFRVFKLDESNMNDVYYAAGDYTQDLLTMLESNVKSDRTDLDLLFGCLLEWGLPLSMPYKSEKIEGCTVHTYNDGDLIACFDENISDTVIKEIARRQPLRAVFRDSSFNDSPAKINVGEIFKMLAPDTRVKVI